MLIEASVWSTCGIHVELIKSADVHARLALMYAKGIRVQKDEDRSADLYRKMAMAGYAPAQAELGYLYSIGRGLPKDQDEYIYWTCEAAAQGNRRAIRNLAIKQTYDLFDPKECPERRARKRGVPMRPAPVQKSGRRSLPAVTLKAPRARSSPLR